MTAGKKYKNSTRCWRRMRTITPFVSILSCMWAWNTTTTSDTTTPTRAHSNQHNKGWRFAAESSWTLWRSGGSPQGHPRYTSASKEEGRGWPEVNSTYSPTNDKRQQDQDKPWVKRVFSARCSQTLGIWHLRAEILELSIFSEKPSLGSYCRRHNHWTSFGSFYFGNSWRIRHQC